MTLHAAYDATLEYLRRVALGLDLFASTISGGEPGDTISLRAAVARNENKRWGCVLCKFLNIFQADHCGKTILADDAQRLEWGDEVRAGKTPL